MRPTASARTFLFCLVMLIIALPPCLAQTYPDSGTQFTNGQNGTPNLPLATSCTIDKTHFAYEVDTTAIYTMMQTGKGPKPPLPPPPVPTSYLYVGSEVRTGSGRPIYVLPALNYGADKYGLEIGSESFYEFGNENDRGRDSVGLSLKLELTDSTRALFRKVAAVKESQNKNHNRPTDDATALGTQTLGTQTTDLLKDYVRKTRYPVVSFIVGDRFVNDGGSLSQFGLSSSQLFPLYAGGPGVTLLGVVQRFNDHLRGDARRGATRFGAALIFRDKTPSLNTTNDRLGPTWKFKEGLEYTSPVFGLKETYAEFVTYRDPNSYGEITLTAGKDGLRKNYLDISIGRSFVF